MACTARMASPELTPFCTEACISMAGLPLKRSNCGGATAQRTLLNMESGIISPTLLRTRHSPTCCGCMRKGASPWIYTRFTRPFNYLGVPALSVPCGFTANGLPVGFQLAGRPFAEALLFRLGHAYQQATDWHLRAPSLP